MALNLDYRVTLVDSSGNPVSVGGGTQYADGATQANPTGNVALWLDTSNVLRAVSATKPLPVQGGDAAGAAIARNPFVVAGQNGGNAKLWAMNSTGQGTVTGALSHNNAAPGTDMLQAMGALANAAVPTYTEGNIVLQSVDLSGRLRTAGTLTNNGAAPAGNNLGVLPVIANAAAPSWTEGRQVLLSTDLAGNLRALSLGTLTNNNAAPAATHIGALTALANATAPTWTEGNEALASVTLKGDTRVVAGGYCPAAPTCTFTRGANTTAYTIGDEVGTASTAPTAITVGRFNGASGVIQGAQVVYSSFAATTPQLVLMLFSATVTLAGDNAQLALSDSDAKMLIGIIPLTASQSGQYSAGSAVAAGNTIFTGAPAAPIHFTCAGGAQTIFACLITLNAFTPIANSETCDVTLQVEQN